MFPSWFTLSIEGWDVKQINTNELYDLGKTLQGLRSLPQDPSKLTQEHRGAIMFAGVWLHQFLDSKLIPLDVAHDAGQKLQNAIDNVTSKFSDNRQIEAYELWFLPTYLTQFETIMGAELQKQLTFIVSQVGGYSMPLLVNQAEVNLNLEAETLNVLPNSALKDFREAGKALALIYQRPVGFM